MIKSGFYHQTHQQSENRQEVFSPFTHRVRVTKQRSFISIINQYFEIDQNRSSLFYSSILQLSVYSSFHVF